MYGKHAAVGEGWGPKLNSKNKRLTICVQLHRNPVGGNSLSRSSTQAREKVSTHRHLQMQNGSTPIASVRATEAPRSWGPSMSTTSTSVAHTCRVERVPGRWWRTSRSHEEQSCWKYAPSIGHSAARRGRRVHYSSRPSGSRCRRSQIRTTQRASQSAVSSREAR